MSVGQIIIKLSFLLGEFDRRKFVDKKLEQLNESEISHSVKFAKISSHYYYKSLKEASIEFDVVYNIDESASSCNPMAEMCDATVSENLPLESHERDNFNNKKLLIQLVELFNSNKEKVRYSEDLKDVSLYVFLLGGPSLYEFLVKNLGLPSISTVRRHLSSKEDCDFIEGVIRGEQLLNFLKSHKYPLQGFVSEDQTKVTSQLKYCSASNRIVGLIGPLDGDTGLPNCNIFEFQSMDKAYQLVQSHKKAEYVNILMFQTLTSGAMSFCLTIYGSDNSFNFSHAINRWKTTRNALNLLGISVLGSYLLFFIISLSIFFLQVSKLFKSCT